MESRESAVMAVPQKLIPAVDEQPTLPPALSGERGTFSADALTTSALENLSEKNAARAVFRRRRNLACFRRRTALVDRARVSVRQAVVTPQILHLSAARQGKHTEKKDYEARPGLWLWPWSQA